MFAYSYYGNANTVAGPKFAKGPHMRISQMRFEDLKVVDSHSRIVELRGKIFGNIKPKTGVIFFKILIHQ